MYVCPPATVVFGSRSSVSWPPRIQIVSTHECKIMSNVFLPSQVLSSAFTTTLHGAILHPHKPSPPLSKHLVSSSEHFFPRRAVTGMQNGADVSDALFLRLSPSDVSYNNREEMCETCSIKPSNVCSDLCFMFQQHSGSPPGVNAAFNTHNNSAARQNI